MGEAVPLIGNAIEMPGGYRDNPKHPRFPPLKNKVSGNGGSTFDSRLVNEGIKTFQVHFCFYVLKCRRIKLNMFEVMGFSLPTRPSRPKAHIRGVKTPNGTCCRLACPSGYLRGYVRGNHRHPFQLYLVLYT